MMALGAGRFTLAQGALWLCFGLLVLLVLVVLLRACGLVLPGYGSWHSIGLNYCAGGEPPFAQTSPTEELADVARNLEMQLAQRRIACRIDGDKARGPSRPVCLPPNVTARTIMIFDTSRSKALPAGDSPELVELEERLMKGDNVACQRFLELIRQPGRKRLDDAKSAALELVAAMPAEIEMGLVTFDECYVRRNVEPTRSRDAMVSELNKAAADGATPIAGAIRAVAGMLKGVPNVESVVVLTDGSESCRGDPCAEARALNRAFPGVKIHDFDVTGSSKLQCVADTTGGTLQTTKDVSVLRQALAAMKAGLESSLYCKP